MSSKARYGLYVATELARRYSETEVVSVCALAKATGVTEKYLEQIIALMKKDGIVVATRGSFGGYKLSASPEEISVGRVLRAVEDNFENVACLECSKKCNCVSVNLWTKLYEHVNDYLDTVSLQQLADGI